MLISKRRLAKVIRFWRITKTLRYFPPSFPPGPGETSQLLSPVSHAAQGREQHFCCLNFLPILKFMDVWKQPRTKFLKAGKFHESSSSIVWGAEIIVWNFMNTKDLDIIYTVSSIVSSLFRVSFEALWYCFSLWSVLIWKANCLTQGLTARPPYLKAKQPGNVQNIFCRLTVLGIEAPVCDSWKAVHGLGWVTLAGRPSVPVRVVLPLCFEWCARNHHRKLFDLLQSETKKETKGQL